MNFAELWAEIEADQTWRQDEIRFFQNQSAKVDSTEKQDYFRRALILLLYAHYEGFCKFTFQLYITAVNSVGITCGEANYAIAAASLSDIFQALRNPEKKSDHFRNELPDDTALHRFARDREFLESSSGFESFLINITDSVIDTESNLKPVVLRKNLFRLGFSHDQFMHLEGKIHLLLNYRNKIAHGELKTGINKSEYERVRDAAYEIMNNVKRGIMQGLQNKNYLREINV